MKKSNLYLLICVVALLGGCAKEQTAPVNTSAGGAVVRTELSFSVSERSYTAAALMDATDTHNNSGCAGENEYAFNQDQYTDWTAYSAASRSFSLTRQDVTTDPAYRLNLWVPADLDALTLPTTIPGARLTLRDLQRVFVPLSDNPADNGPVELIGTGEGISLTITAVQGNVVEGSFNGLVKAANGTEVRLENGRFKAQLTRL